MDKGKSKLTRQDAERLFEGLPSAKASVSSRPENPFAPDVSNVVKRVEDESVFWILERQPGHAAGVDRTAAGVPVGASHARSDDAGFAREVGERRQRRGCRGVS